MTTTLKIKALFEMSRFPVSFSRERPTKIPCRGGWVYVKWIGNRWSVTANNHRTQYPDESELRGLVRELCLDLGGLS